jgi:hypothetical protein
VGSSTGFEAEGAREEERELRVVGSSTGLGGWTQCQGAEVSMAWSLDAGLALLCSGHSSDSSWSSEESEDFSELLA